MKEIEFIKYDTNFTAGGLLFNEFLSLERIILRDDFVAALKKEESLNEYSGIKTNGARVRILREVKRRVRQTPKDFWIHFYQWSEKEQKLGLLYACLETYKIVFDLHWEVAIVKYKTGGTLDDYSISTFLDEVSSKNEYVASWSAKTIEKIKTRYIRALQDAGLLHDNRLQKPQGISAPFWSYFRENNISWFLEACFIA